MTRKERDQLHGFWTHKQTGEYIAVTRVTVTSEVYFYKTNYTGHKAGTQEIMLLRELKKDYVKGMR